MLKKFFARLSTFLYYNKTERNGVIVLSFLLLLLFSGLYLYDNFVVRTNADKTAFFAKVDSIEAASMPKQSVEKYFSFNPNTSDSSTLRKLGFSVKQIHNLQNYRKAGGFFRKKEDFNKLYFVNDSIYKVYQSYISIPKKKKVVAVQHDEPAKKKKVVDTLFIFNPNSISKEQWMQLGVSKKTTAIIQNYIAKGGRFYKKEDVKKIYGLSETDYERLAPYINIPKKKVLKKTIHTHDLNTVTQEDLQELKLSKSMARRVVRYREKLGGYAQVAQLMEVYDMNEYSFKLLQKHCEIKTGVRQITINTATAKELCSHPYLTFQDAEAIIRYRERKGDYESVNVLQARKILADKVFEKMKFYLKVKNSGKKIGK